MSIIKEDSIEDVSYRLMKKATIELPEDVKKALRDSYERETSKKGKNVLKSILENIRIAEEKQVCLCQDTGIPIFFIKFGWGMKVEGNLLGAIERAVRRATRDIPLRPNVYNPMTLENPGTNVGWGMPYIHYELEPDADYIEITALPKGFGSEMKAMLMWGDEVIGGSFEGRKKCIMKGVLDAVTMSLNEPCPPGIVSIGVGGTMDIAMYLAKKAMLRPVGSKNADPLIAELEEDLLSAINETGIGPMAVGGDITALAVHVEACGTHTCVLPLAITFQCWAKRQATARLYTDRVEYLT